MEGRERTVKNVTMVRFRGPLLKGFGVVSQLEGLLQHQIIAVWVAK